MPRRSSGSSSNNHTIVRLCAYPLQAGCISQKDASMEQIQGKQDNSALTLRPCSSHVSTSCHFAERPMQSSASCSSQAAYVSWEVASSQHIHAVIFLVVLHRLDASLKKWPACSTPRRSSGSSNHRRRWQVRGPSASADFDMNKENRLQQWLEPGGSLEQPLKAKRKLYCGETALASLSSGQNCMATMQQAHAKCDADV